MSVKLREPKSITADKVLEPEAIKPGFNWNRQIPAHGHSGVDFEERVNFRRLHDYRLSRAKAALADSKLGSILCFDNNNICYLTSTVIGEWSREKMCRFALLTGNGEPFLWDFAVGDGSMILLCRHPGADVRRAVAKHNALAGFAVAQQAHGVTIRQDQIGQVQHHDGTSRFSVDQPAQLADVLSIESTADREHNGRLHRALNLQQRHGCAERNCRSKRKRLNLKVLVDDRRARFRQW